MLFFLKYMAAVFPEVYGCIYFFLNNDVCLYEIGREEDKI